MFGITGLDSQASATPLEMSVVLVGVLLITPIFAPEQNRDIRDVVESKYLDHEGVYMIRAVMAIVLTLIMVSLFVVIMKFNGCDVGLSHVLHTFSSSLFLGGIGFMASGLSDNLTVGYMSAMLYYALNLTGAGKYLGAFCLFSMTYKDVRWKPWLLASRALHRHHLRCKRCHEKAEMKLSKARTVVDNVERPGPFLNYSSCKEVSEVSFLDFPSSRLSAHRQC